MVGCVHINCPKHELGLGQCDFKDIPSHSPLHFKCYFHSLLNHILIITLIYNITMHYIFSNCYKNKDIMSPNKLNSLAILFGLIAALASTNLLTPNITKHLVDFVPSSLCSIPFLVASLIRRNHRHNHHHHTDEDKPGNKTNLCDNFPPDFPPPDTNTTSFFCVDRNGCCNFTTVQAAVDAVGVMSPKRNIIWINNGVYL